MTWSSGPCLAAPGEGFGIVVTSETVELVGVTRKIPRSLQATDVYQSDLEESFVRTKLSEPGD